jgi:hypothetical protein
MPQVNLLDSFVLKSEMIIIKPFHGTAKEWDDFAKLCGGSFRSGYYGVRAWQLDYHIIHSLRRLCCYINRGSKLIKIAQTAIGSGVRHRIFSEGLLLLPEFQSMWNDVMFSVLNNLGPGKYQYGSPWSLEPCREIALSLMPGITIISAEPVTVSGVDFARWNSWEAYYKDISTNAKRNAKKAEKTYDKLLIKTDSGLAALKHLYNQILLRRQLSIRKKIDSNVVRLAVRFFTRCLVMGHNAFTSIVYVDNIPMAAFSGITFGESTYFIEAGSVENNNGLFWFLLLHMLRDAYQRSPSGKFISNYRRARDAEVPGLAFSHRQYCNTTYLTSEVIFEWANQTDSRS